MYDFDLFLKYYFLGSFISVMILAFMLLITKDLK